MTADHDTNGLPLSSLWSVDVIAPLNEVRLILYQRSTRQECLEIARKIVHRFNAAILVNPKGRDVIRFQAYRPPQELVK